MIPSRMQYSRWSLTRVESTRTESAPLTCCPHCSGCSPRYFLSSKHTLPAHNYSFIPAPPSSSPQGFSQSTHPPGCNDTRGCPKAGAGPYTSPCWPWDCHVPTSWACQGPSCLIEIVSILFLLLSLFCIYYLNLCTLITHFIFEIFLLFFCWYSTEDNLKHTF